MVSKWLQPEPRPKQVDETPPYNSDAPSFDLMKRQVGKKSPKVCKEVFILKSHRHIRYK